MLTIRDPSRGGFAVAFALLMASSAAHAGNPCIGDAKETFTDCKGDCKESYQTAKDACLQRDHDCVEGCRAGRAECILSTSLDEDLTACRDTLRAAKDQCRSDNAGDDAAIDQCIDAAQVTAFLCRKAARTAARPAITACRAGFRACAQACPTTGNEVIDKPACKLAAKDAYLDCKAGCREEFQTQKDLCLGRDHACVENCRAGRDACRQPVEDQLDAAIASCNATKASEVAACKNNFPEGPDRDACILDALVKAFQCRDQAREDAKPGFESCRAGFVACAQACPPPPS
jgi:hypothetical protein